MELWKVDLVLYTKMDREIWKQIHSMPEAEVIEWHFQHGFYFDEMMQCKRELKGDCIWKCWN